MKTVDYVADISNLRRTVAEWRAAGETVALLPTMGAIHEGHLSLARAGKEQCDRLVTSIFVNPAQFAPEEDFSNYPRTFASDLAKLHEAQCDLVWAPTADVMYPDGFATMIQPEGAALGLETDFRPHFFAGVATVCSKLFLQALPDIALFGEKDYQQLCVIRQIVRDLDLPLTIVGCETVREDDGLAMSSRNAYLSKEERRIATELYRVLREVAAEFAAGAEPDAACRAGRQTLLDAGFAAVDYLAIRDAERLQPVTAGTPQKCRVLAAAWLGQTRLIDNIACN